MSCRRRRIGSAGAALVAAACVLGAWAPVAGATSATATLSAGSLAFVSGPPAVSFTALLNGTNLAPIDAQALDVSDATGSGSGWNITATSTTFTTGSHTLATTATTIADAPTVACDALSTCTAATNSITYPYTLPAATSAPTATKLFDAAANTGIGNQTVTPTWTLSVPSGTLAGTYTSTWTFSLVSGP
jgi:hypothetical protein